jgi:heme A synthase
MVRQGRLFSWLVLSTAGLTLGLIVFGAVVRVTDSGLGCGNHWPSCNGTFFPPLDNVTAWIEWLHRLFAALIGLLGLGSLAVAAAAYRRRNRAVLVMTAIAAVLFTVQSALGALVVVLDLPPTMVTLHLGAAMLLLGALLAAGVFALYRPKRTYGRDSFTSLVYLTAAMTLLIILTGALVRGSGSTLACLDWPLCNGEVLPIEQGRSAVIHMTHRFAVVGLGIMSAMLVWMAFRQRQQPAVRILSVLAFALYLMQAGVGALFVLSAAAPIWGAAHVGLAASMWAALVALGVVETMNHRPQTQIEDEQAWQLPASQAQPSPTA